MEFHYYSTAFLAVKAGLSLPQATLVAHASQYVDHHIRPLRVVTDEGTLEAPATQTLSFWQEGAAEEILAPFHFLPAGLRGAYGPYPSVRRDGRCSAWDVRPNSPPARELLVAALRSGDLVRIGVALHTFSDTWAHQNFSALTEDWNGLGTAPVLPAPGHAQAGRSPDLWLEVWEDPRLTGSRIVNLERFSACAAKVYRYLCVWAGKDFHGDEARVLAELRDLVQAGRGREKPEERVLAFVVTLGLEPYDRDRWADQALEAPEEGLRRWGQTLWDRTGLAGPRTVRARPGFAATPLAAFFRAAAAHRASARVLIDRVRTGGVP